MSNMLKCNTMIKVQPNFLIFSVTYLLRNPVYYRQLIEKMQQVKAKKAIFIVMADNILHFYDILVDRYHSLFSIYNSHD